VGEEGTIRMGSFSAKVLAVLRSLSKAVTAHDELFCKRTGTLLEKRAILAPGGGNCKG